MPPLPPPPFGGTIAFRIASCDDTQHLASLTHTILDAALTTRLGADQQSLTIEQTQRLEMQLVLSLSLAQPPLAIAVLQAAAQASLASDVCADRSSCVATVGDDGAGHGQLRGARANLTLCSRFSTLTQGTLQATRRRLSAGVPGVPLNATTLAAYVLRVHDTLVSGAAIAPVGTQAIALCVQPPCAVSSKYYADVRLQFTRS